MAHCERPKKNQNLERLAVNSYGKILNGVSFLTESEQNQNGSFHVNNQPQVHRGWGGDTPLYQLYRYVPPRRVWFLSCFGLKTGIDFDHYGLKSGMVFKETTRAFKRICLSFQLQINKREKEKTRKNHYSCF